MFYHCQMCKERLDDPLKGLLVTSFKLHKSFQIRDVKWEQWSDPEKGKRLFSKILISPGDLFASLDLV